MPFAKHLRVTAIGTLEGTPEQFSYGVSVAPANTSNITALFNLEPNDTGYQGIADALANYHGSPGAGIALAGKLRAVKIAFIDTDGSYSKAPIIKEYNINGGGNGGLRYPAQVALAVTMDSDTFPVRHSRFYSPYPTWALASDGRISAADAASQRDAAQTMLNDINNEPGVDLLDLRVVLARSNGTNVVLEHVRVGRVLDTIRRRRNKLVEGYTAPVDLG